MRLLAVCVGLPREVSWKGRMVKTSIFKEPVSTRIRMRPLNLDGDQQADLTVHGGAEKAVYAYPSEHYAYWRSQLPQMELPWGAFGENLTLEGLSESTVHIGDCFRIGSAEVMVTQPRFPCYKLNLKFGRDDMVRRFLQSGLSGIYFSVTKAGEVAAGDTVEQIYHDAHNITVTDIVNIYRQRADSDLIRRAIAVPALAESLRDYFQQQLS